MDNPILSWEVIKARADDLAEEIIHASGGDPKRTREAGNLILAFVNDVMRSRGIRIEQIPTV